MTPDGRNAGLTREQLDVVESSGNCFVDACPGAGKTRTVVELFLKVAEELPPRHGVAVCSYTNVAADEVRARCLALNRPELCRFPNYLGTFDGFISRYFVVPFGMPDSSRIRPRVVESWDAIGCQVLVPVGKDDNRIPVSLDAFPLGPDWEPRLAPNRLPREYRSAVARAVDQHVLRSTWGVRKRAWSKGYLSCDDCRALAFRRLRDERWRGPVLSALAARFKMVVVDEAQDCNGLDLEVVQRIRDAGVRTVVVADPNQAIFCFRGADAKALSTCVEGMRRFPLTRNFRSTQTICQLAGSLRREPVVESTDYVGVQPPVLLLSYDGELGAEIGKVFSSEIAQHGIAPRDAIVLAHEYGAALQAVGRPTPSDDGGGSMACRLADSVVRFRAGSDPRNVVRSLEVVQRLLVRRLALERDGITPEHAVEDAAVSARWLRIEALRLMGQLQQLPMTEGEEEPWTENARQILARARPPAGTAFKQTAQQVLRRGSKFVLPSLPSCEVEIPAATVHSVKGREYDAVFLVLPCGNRTEQVLKAWADRADDEARAVLYVGATRARRLLAIGVPAVFRAQVQALASRGGACCREVFVRGQPSRGRARASDSSQASFGFIR